MGQEYSGTLEESTILGPTLMPQFTLPYIALLLVPPQNPNPSQALRKSPYDTRERDLVKESSVGSLHCLFPSRVPCAPPLPPPPRPCTPSGLGPTPQEAPVPFPPTSQLAMAAAFQLSQAAVNTGSPPHCIPHPSPSNLRVGGGLDQSAWRLGTDPSQGNGRAIGLGLSGPLRAGSRHASCLGRGQMVWGLGTIQLHHATQARARYRAVVSGASCLTTAHCSSNPHIFN